MNYLVPTGIGDVVWALHKVQDIERTRGDGHIHIWIQCDHPSEINTRAFDFVSRFSFVASVEGRPYGIHPATRYLPDGCYNYLQDGVYELDGEKFVLLVPNAALEHGVRLEDWLPHYRVNWDIWRDFCITPKERELGQALRDGMGDYAVFYLGPLHGNTVNGHNRNALWRPDDWITLGNRIRDQFGLHVVVVGASYDASYYDAMIGPRLNGAGGWTNLIGRTSLGQLWSVTSLAKFVISYQAGVGIVAAYLGTPTMIWWRPHGNSISPEAYLTFDERMSSAWASPAILERGTYAPLIYNRHGVEYIVSEVTSRGWASCLR